MFLSKLWAKVIHLFNKDETINEVPAQDQVDEEPKETLISEIKPRQPNFTVEKS